MNLAPVDWLILAALYVVVMGGVVVTKRYMRSVADFLAAGRTAGRYMLALASGMAALGAISIVRDFQMNYEAGFAMSWWGLTMALFVMLVAVTGWVNYRFRETRALTLAEFFERRYSRRFRLFAGFVAFGAGLINFGIFPSVGARFFIHFIGLPDTLSVLGLALPTYPTMMAFLLLSALYFVFAGGHVAVMITDFIQGAFANVVFILLTVFMLTAVPWEHVIDVLTKVPVGKSKLNPFDTGYVETFNFRFFAIGVIGLLYGAMSWQGTQAYNSSARSAHEAKMGLVVGLWRGLAQGLAILLIPIFVFVVMHHPQWLAVQDAVNGELARIDNAQVRSQMLIPAALAVLLPAGLIGAFAALMLGAFLSTHNTYLHSWGSIFIQDVVLPMRGRPVGQRTHLALLRLSCVGVAVFIFFFSLLYEQNQEIALFFALTGAIFAGWSGSAIIGGLYWKRGTTEAAWAAGIVGTTISVGGLIIGHANDHFRETGRAFWGALDWIGYERSMGLAAWFNAHLPNGQELWGLAMPTCAAVYVLISLLWRPRVFNLEKLLHRGRYTMPEDRERVERVPERGWRVLGMNEYFTRRDRFLYILTYAWNVSWVIVFVTGTVYFLTRGASGSGWGVYDGIWIRYWKTYIWIHIVVSSVVVTWFTIGGARDVITMVRMLRAAARDEADDGVVRERSG